MSPNLCSFLLAGFESRGPPDAGDPRRNPIPDFRGPPDLRGILFDDKG